MASVQPFLLTGAYAVHVQAVFWNLYNIISIHCQSTQPEKASSQSASHRFLIKLLKKHPDSVPLMMLVAHHCAITRNLGLGMVPYAYLGDVKLLRLPF